jgi:hypothetical protein
MSRGPEGGVRCAVRYGGHAVNEVVGVREILPAEGLHWACIIACGEASGRTGAVQWTYWDVLAKASGRTGQSQWTYWPAGGRTGLPVGVLACQWTYWPKSVDALACPWTYWRCTATGRTWPKPQRRRKGFEEGLTGRRLGRRPPQDYVCLEHREDRHGRLSRPLRPGTSGCPLRL